jgi:hypothetical protein
MNNDTSKIFKLNLLKNGLLLVISLVFVFLGIYLMEEQSIAAWVGICFFGLCALVFSIQFHPKASYLKLNDEGFEVRSLFRSHFTKWSHIKNLRIGNVPGNRMIFFDFTDDYGKRSPMKKAARSLSRNKGAVPSSYVISTKELLNIMETYLQKSRGNMGKSKMN